MYIHSIPASRESGVKAFIKRRPLLSVYLVMFALLLIAFTRGRLGHPAVSSKVE